jgi:hypothetical protein
MEGVAMSETEIREQDSEVAEQAVRALDEATRRSRQSAVPLVLVVDGNLVRTGPSGTTILKKLAPRLRVANRVKRAKL